MDPVLTHGSAPNFSVRMHRSLRLDCNAEASESGLRSELLHRSKAKLSSGWSVVKRMRRVGWMGEWVCSDCITFGENVALC